MGCASSSAFDQDKLMVFGGKDDNGVADEVSELITEDWGLRLTPKKKRTLLELLRGPYKLPADLPPPRIVVKKKAGEDDSNAARDAKRKPPSSVKLGPALRAAADAAEHRPRDQSLLRGRTDSSLDKVPVSGAEGDVEAQGIIFSAGNRLAGGGDGEAPVQETFTAPPSEPPLSPSAGAATPTPSPTQLLTVERGGNEKLGSTSSNSPPSRAATSVQRSRSRSDVGSPPSPSPAKGGRSDHEGSSSVSPSPSRVPSKAKPRKQHRAVRNALRPAVSGTSISSSSSSTAAGRSAYRDTAATRSRKIAAKKIDKPWLNKA